MEEESAIEKALFDMNLKINQLHQEQARFLESDSTQKGSKMYMYDTAVKLPKISVPSFYGNLLNWNTFWEQFEDSHSLKGTTDGC